jgi:hypothetical protein
MTLKRLPDCLLAAFLPLFLTAHLPAACSYFAARDKDITQPGQKAFISFDPAAKLESFTVQPRFEGNALDFGMVIPTPAQPKLDEMPRDFFKDLAIYTILMPLPEPIWTGWEPELALRGGFGGGPGKTRAALAKKDGVRVLESGVVGSLDYKVIVAEEARALYDWLKENGYSYAGDEGTLDHYIQKRWFFTVMKIDSKQMKKAADGSYTGEVTPTRFTFRSERCVYPLKITRISVKDKTDALFYVQAPAQMDLQGDWSWQHSFRVMYLTYALGCGATPDEQVELTRRNGWIQGKMARDPAYETTKLEWAKRLGGPEMAVLEDPQKNYAQMGTGALVAGAKAISLPEFLKEVKEAYLKQNQSLSEHPQRRLTEMEDQYQPSKGIIVKSPAAAAGRGFMSSPYMWYPNRQAPADDVKGLARLKGHLRSGQWLTKFRKVLRKDEMAEDMILEPVAGEIEQSYVRILPTSPP